MSVACKFMSVLVILPCHFTGGFRFHEGQWIQISLFSRGNLYQMHPSDFEMKVRPQGLLSSSAGGDKGPLFYCPNKSLTGCAGSSLKVSLLIRIMTGKHFPTLNACSMTKKCKEFPGYSYWYRMDIDCELNQWWLIRNDDSVNRFNCINRLGLFRENIAPKNF